MKPHRHAETVSQGVDELLQRLKTEGLEAGKREAEALVAAARQEAQAIVDAAKDEAERLRAAARWEAHAERQSGEDALQAAARDALLGLRQTLMERFSADLQRLVATTMDDPAVIRAMIVEAAAGAGAAVGGRAPQAGLLPQEGDDEALRRDSEAIKAEPSTGVLLASMRRVLSEGVSVEAAAASARGAVLRLHEGAVEIDLSDAAVARLIVARLAPRFRALFDGVIR